MRSSMVAEMCAAALHGPLVYTTSPYLPAGDGASWSEWFASLLTSAISAAPLDLIDDWSTALRLGLNGLVQTTQGLPQLLDLLAGMIAPGVLTFRQGVIVGCPVICIVLDGARHPLHANPPLLLCSRHAP